MGMAGCMFGSELRPPALVPPNEYNSSRAVSRNHCLLGNLLLPIATRRYTLLCELAEMAWDISPVSNTLDAPTCSLIY